MQKHIIKELNTPYTKKGDKQLRMKSQTWTKISYCCKRSHTFLSSVALNADVRVKGIDLSNFNDNQLIEQDMSHNISNSLCTDSKESPKDVFGSKLYYNIVILLYSKLLSK